jgi:hypothetical protein
MTKRKMSHLQYLIFSNQNFSTHRLDVVNGMVNGEWKRVTSEIYLLDFAVRVTVGRVTKMNIAVKFSTL